MALVPSRIRSITLAALVAILSLMTISTTTAQEAPPPNPIDLPCATNMSAQVLNATPVGDGTQTLILARVIFGPGASLGAHTHPGTVAATVESGLFGFTLIDEAEMLITRAASADSDATSEPLVPGEEAVLNPGDSFIEMGMVHSATNLSDGQTTVLLSGLIETGQPLTACVAD
jgi:quercetin dioxygenase-like cupin family protein